MIITRFAPSPTGFMHLGNVRTALYNFLYTKQENGKFIVRIEDTDTQRSEAQYSQAIQDDLHWLGLAFDALYFQSNNTQHYDAAYQKLIDQQAVYYCTCSKERLDALKVQQRQDKKPPRYDKRCQNQHEKPNEPSVLRFKSPALKVEDFVIRRQDNTPVFLFCNALDDARMKITHVIRGQDHLANQAKQTLLLKTLNMPSATYIHIPLILNTDSSVLSKRHNHFHIHRLRQLGYTSLAITNYLFRLGHACLHNDVLNMSEMIQQFNASQLSKSPAKFNAQQLNFWQQKHVQSMQSEALLTWANRACISWGKPPELWLKSIQKNINLYSDIEQWNAIFFQDNLSFQDCDTCILQEAGVSFFETLIQKIDALDCIEALHQWSINSMSEKGKKLFLPIRIALTGLRHGPELPIILSTLGSQKAKTRFQNAVRLITLQK